MMNTRQKLLSMAVITACGSLSSQAQAALANNAILKFNTGVQTVSSVVRNGTTYTSTTTTGSYFSMDTENIGTVEESEKTMLSVNAGVAIGATQPASGSHTGTIDGTESPGIDDAWEFFGNTGMHQTTSDVTILSDNGAGTVTLDFGGWNVTWNGIASIPMGGDTANFSADNNIANVTCYTDSTKGTTADCADGTFFVLDHDNVHVPLGDPSGFGNVAYTVHLEGTIFVPPAMTTSNTSVAAGTYATAAGSADQRLSIADLTAQGVAADTGYTFSGGLYDFTVTTGAGVAAEVMMTLTAAIPADAVYRKYINGAWTTFTADGTNLIASAAKVAGSCPVVGDAAYDHSNGLVEGDECVEITIANDGVYDGDTASNTTVIDPGGVATAVQTYVDTRTYSTSGCSMSETPVNVTERADWWLVAGFLGALAWLRGMRRKAL